MSLHEQIMHRMVEFGGRLRVRSALNPILWLCALVTIPVICIITRYTFAPNWLIAIAVAPVGCAIFGYLFLLIFDRDKLQSEDYQIRKQTLELIQEKGDKFPILGTSIQAIANPDLPQSPASSKEIDK